MLQRRLSASTFGFRGDISDDADALPRDVFPVSQAGKPAIGFLAGSIKKHETLPKLVDTFGAALDGDGKYVIYISGLQQDNWFSIKFCDVKIIAIFIDDTSV